MKMTMALRLLLLTTTTATTGVMASGGYACTSSPTCDLSLPNACCYVTPADCKEKYTPDTAHHGYARSGHNTCVDLSGDYLCCTNYLPDMPFANKQCTECDGQSVNDPTECDPNTFAGVIDMAYTTCIPTPPEGSGGAFDDPHFKTWNGQWYDFMGACDLHLVKAPEFAGPNTSLVIDIRTKTRYNYSYIESAVIQIGNDPNHTLEVGSFGAYFLKGISNAELPAQLGGFPVTHSQPTPDIHLFTIQFSDTEFIRIKTYKDMVSVNVDHAKPKRLHGAVGMMGNYDNNNNKDKLLVGRDGVTDLSHDLNQLAAEWQVRDDEPMLFQTVQGPQYPQQCQMPEETAAMVQRRRRLGESLVARAAAEEACAEWKENKEGCIHDVMATGDLGLAAAGLF